MVRKSAGEYDKREQAREREKRMCHALDRNGGGLFCNTAPQCGGMKSFMPLMYDRTKNPHYVSFTTIYVQYIGHCIHFDVVEKGQGS